MLVDERLFFHLTGKRSGSLLDASDGDGLRPALFARFHDLPRLRYDFPVILLEREDAPFETLSGIVDALLRDVAPKGIAGERLRRNVLRLEREVRALIAEGAAGSLSALWDRAAERLATKGGEPVASDLARARAALHADGAVIDCDATTSARFVTHAWRTVQERRARSMRRAIDVLVAKLSDLVKADFLRSEAGRHAATLRAAVGAPHQGLFDFEAMARLLAAPSGASALPESKRRRIEAALGVLRTQRFFGADRAYGFAFDRIDAAVTAYRERLPAMAELVRAITVAELEVQGRYVEAKHDEYFRGFDARSLGPEQLAIFPDYLVSLDAQARAAEGGTRLIEALTCGAPLKVLLETDDAFGVGAQLATTAMGLGDVFALQSTGSHLYQARKDVVRALEYRGPALLSVFSGAVGGATGAPPYLVAAAALESRAFPAFTYDPSAGTDWAQRISLDGNPQPERPWPIHELAYADEAMRHASEQVPFTLADLALCDPRRSEDFVGVPREQWSADLVPLARWLDGRTDGADEAVPFVYAIDAEARLHRVVVDQRLVHATRRCADAWHRLRQLCEPQRGAVAVPVEPVAVLAAAPAAPPVAAVAPAQQAPASDDPYIETARCTSCNECTGMNARMFVYDENKQAFIADPAAGTYRELVEAAESCQVAIIHPGKPRDPNEPGLDELLRRAEAFL